MTVTDNRNEGGRPDARSPSISTRFKLKFSPDKVDTMIVQAIALLDDLDKEINIYSMRVKVRTRRLCVRRRPPRKMRADGLRSRLCSSPPSLFRFPTSPGVVRMALP